MVILGIDPGWDRCGWAKVLWENNQSSLIEAGLITTAKSKDKSVRLLELFEKISAVCAKGPQPDAVVLEEVHTPPLGYRIANLVEVGEARGVLLMAAAKCAAVVEQIHPLVVKKSITGNGKSKKEDVARFLKFLLPNIPEKAIDDTTDAIAVAMASILSGKLGSSVQITKVN